MAEVEEPAVAADNGSAAVEEVKPYRIHVSSKYLNLTRQKLEIARLPHEFDEPKSKDSWQPKSQVEPLIDFWLEQYRWRDQEEILNSLPQFRTGFAVPDSKTPVRIQFIHARSPRAGAVPLLLIPPFPFSSLSLGHLVGPLAEPDEANHQPFHLVVPSLPGLGFSDALPADAPVVAATADLLDALMGRLGYAAYLVTNASAGSLSPAQIDYKLADRLLTHRPGSCLGAHLISPPLTRPRLQEAPLGWAKWSLARILKASVLGYRSEDLSAMRQSVRHVESSDTAAAAAAGSGAGLGGLTEPNTLAYALCDSPTGLLVLVLRGLRLLAPRKEFAPAEIINFTQLAWLPGPEAALRFWAHCARHPESEKTAGRARTRRPAKRPRVALTVFLGDEQQQAEQREQRAADAPYSCPAWATTRYEVVHAHRAAGNPGLLAWERPELVAAGVRGLAAAVLKVDKRLQPSPETSAPVVVAAGSGGAKTTTTMTTAPAAPSAPNEEEQEGEPRKPSSPGPSEPQPGLLAPPKTGERSALEREVSDDTKVASSESLAAKTPSPVPATPSPVPAEHTPAVVAAEGNKGGEPRSSVSGT
ncbi:alpha/beta-hydrolase [Xylaria palmicola]|nr:alpha/beta-hydrolase [Xylaria palmicola]